MIGRGGSNISRLEAITGCKIQNDNGEAHEHAQQACIFLERAHTRAHVYTHIRTHMHSNQIMRRCKAECFKRCLEQADRIPDGVQDVAVPKLYKGPTDLNCNDSR